MNESYYTLKHMATLSGKKILFVITQSKYGGAQKYLLQLAEHFSKHNTVLIAVGEKDNQDPVFFDKCKKLNLEPIILKSLIREISLVKAYEAVMEIRKLLVKERPDVIHINSSMAGAVGSCAAWLYRFDPLNRLIRVIYTVHGFVFNEPLPPMKKKIFLMIEKVSASWKGAIITVSNYDKEEGLKNKIAPEHRMVVIHNGIDVRTTFESREDARKTLKIDRDQCVIGTIASFYKTKALNILIDAFAQLKINSSKLIIVGDGPERPMLEKQISSLNLANRVTLTGVIPNANRLVRAFDMFILPSVKEGFSYTLLEAGLAGVPIIATRVGGTPELIEHQKSGILVESNSAADLSAAIQSSLALPDLLKSYASALQKKIRNDFTLESMNAKTEELYLQLFPHDTV